MGIKRLSALNALTEIVRYNYDLPSTADVPEPVLILDTSSGRLRIVPEAGDGDYPEDILIDTLTKGEGACQWATEIPNNESEIEIALDEWVGWVAAMARKNNKS